MHPYLTYSIACQHMDAIIVLLLPSAGNPDNTLVVICVSLPFLFPPSLLPPSLPHHCSQLPWLCEGQNVLQRRTSSRICRVQGINSPQMLKCNLSKSGTIRSILYVSYMEVSVSLGLLDTFLLRSMLSITEPSHVVRSYDISAKKVSSC